MLQGEAVAIKIIEDCVRKVEDYKNAAGTSPFLSTVLICDEAGSLSHIKMKHTWGKKAGIRVQHVALATDTSRASLVSTIQCFSVDSGIHGIFLPYPLTCSLLTTPKSRLQTWTIFKAGAMPWVKYGSVANTSPRPKGFIGCLPYAARA
jgi:5,10-methylene-tetrahydrofolate dehydrogenase/methenyl tetrahydrofolate cyclohydrolase